MKRSWPSLKAALRVVGIVTLAPAALSVGQLAAAQQPSTPGATAAQPQADAAQSPVETDAEPASPPMPTRSGEEDVVVTGSRVRRKGLTTASPIREINREQVEASGIVSIGDFLQTLPEQGNAINTSVNSGSTGNGSTRVSLRGLGAVRTLVLLNGRRLVPGGPGADGAVDLSSIPAGALERIEVLKDGASAIYGSDAIGGVINLITRRRMKGVQVTGFAGTSTHGDGTTYDLHALAGTSGDRGSILFSAGYYNQNKVWAGDRAFAHDPTAYSTTGIGVPNNQIGKYIQGSSNVPMGTFVLGVCRPTTPPSVPCQGRSNIPNPNHDPRIDFYNALIARYPANTSTFIRTTPSDPRDKLCDANGNCWRPYSTSQLANEQDPAAGGDGYNFQPENYLVTPQQRVSLFSIGEAKLGNGARGYFEGSFVNRQGGQTLAPEAFNSAAESVSLSRNNIYNPFGVNLGTVHRRLLEFGTRDFRQDIDTFRMVAGLDGTMPEEAGAIRGWYWDLSLNYGRTVSSNLKRGDLFIPALRNALGPSFYDANGAARCGTPNRPIPDCVPLDLLHTQGNITAEMITPNLGYTGNQRGFNQMVAAQFNTSGELFKLFSERPVSLALGYEYRIVSGENIPDPITVAGLTTGNEGAITAGHYYVNEGYGELSIPIVGVLPLAKSIEATAAIRVFNYSNFGTDFTYKFGGLWSIVRDFSLRGTYSTGFRAPSVADLFGGGTDVVATAADPCRGPGVAGGGPVPQNCLNQGVPPSGTDDTATQLRARGGGNPDLKPETAKVYTAGIVFEPSWIRGFSATVDYYNIEINRLIGAIGPQLILNQCYPNNPSATPRYCELVERNPDTLRVSNIMNINQNVGTDATDGIDLALNYVIPTQLGRFNFLFDGIWLHKFDRTLADGSVIHGKNTFDIATTGGVYPAFKFVSGVRYAFQRISAGVSTRFLSSFHQCGTATGDFNGPSRCYDRQQPGDVGVNEFTSRTVSAYNTWNVFASYAFPSLMGQTTIGVGVNNLFNADPAVIYNGSLANSDPTAYDFIGRFFYARISHAF